MCYRVSDLDAPLCAYDNIQRLTKIATRTNKHTLFDYRPLPRCILITL